MESDSFALNAQLLAAVFGIVGGLIGIGKYYSEMLGDNKKRKHQMITRIMKVPIRMTMEKRIRMTAFH